jgi:uncharacterized membrane protein YbaN (DUF454 family)
MDKMPHETAARLWHGWFIWSIWIVRGRINGMDEYTGHSVRRRWVWLAAGFLLVALGFIGALVPLMPTTIFLILAAGCFARSSPRLEAWLLDHPRFGSSLRAWRTEGAIGPKAKLSACIGMPAGFALFWWTVRPGLTVELATGAALACCAGFIVSRPAPGSGPDTQDRQAHLNLD